jgi:hypothetical protein
MPTLVIATARNWLAWRRSQRTRHKSPRNLDDMTIPAVQQYTFTLRQLLAAVAGAAVFSAVLAWASKVNLGWWASQAFAGSVHFYPRIAWVAGGASLAAFIAVAVDRSVWRIRSLWLLSPLAVPLLLLCFGIVFRQNGAEAVADAARKDQLTFIVEIFPWAVVPLGIVLMVGLRSVSHWVAIVGISISAYWLSQGAQFISMMSVTDDWL